MRAARSASAARIVAATSRTSTSAIRKSGREPPATHPEEKCAARAGAGVVRADDQRRMDGHPIEAVGVERASGLLGLDLAPEVRVAPAGFAGPDERCRRVDPVQASLKTTCELTSTTRSPAWSAAPSVLSDSPTFAFDSGSAALS